MNHMVQFIIHRGNRPNDYKQLGFIQKCYYLPWSPNFPPEVDSASFLETTAPSHVRGLFWGRDLAEQANALKANPKEELIFELLQCLWHKYAASPSACFGGHGAHLGSSGCVSFNIRYITLSSHLVRQGSGSPESREGHVVPSVWILFNFISWLSGCDLASSFSGSGES